MDSAEPPGEQPPVVPELAALVVINPSGNRTRVPLQPVPFRMGRMGGNHLVLRDSRISRQHAQIVCEEGQYFLEDLHSSHGVYWNGERIQKQKLENSDRIEFGFPDSYQLIFTLEERGLHQALDRVPTHSEASPLGTNLAKLRAMVEVARALQTALSTDEVLAAVVEAALAVTGCERGFLLLRSGDDLEIRVARGRSGPLEKTDLRVPTRLLLRALNQRKDFLSMNFDLTGQTDAGPEHTVADLELRSVVAVPMVRIRTGRLEETSVLSPAEDTVGLLYMDSRGGAADLSAGSRELLTTLALEASTILENARLLEQQWARQRMEEELRIARRIQQSLLPRVLPASGWLRAAGTSVPSQQVGGDYFDVREIAPTCWASVLADVSGKGVGSALLAALLQGMFLAAPYTAISMEEMMFRVNRFLFDRTQGEQFVTLFYSTLDSDGLLRWINAGHPPPLLVRKSGELRPLPASGVPLGMLEEAFYDVQETQLEPGDKLAIYSDGLSEARNAEGEFFGLKRVRNAVLGQARGSCQQAHDALASALETFAEGAVQNDDITLLVLEFSG
jgi:serine phosphatase RsbU (regulator of sigma subunit)